MPRTTLDDRDRELLSARTSATSRPRGRTQTIHTVPIWVDLEGENVVLNTEATRAWPKNLRRTGHTTLTVLNMENPYEYLTVTGHLAEETEDGAREHADARVLPQGTAFISDVGMTASRTSILGVKYQQALDGFRTHLPQKFETGDEDVWVNAVVVEVNDRGLADSIEQVLEPVPGP